MSPYCNTCTPNTHTSCVEDKSQMRNTDKTFTSFSISVPIFCWGEPLSSFGGEETFVRVPSLCSDQMVWLLTVRWGTEWSWWSQTKRWGFRASGPGPSHSPYSTSPERHDQMMETSSICVPKHNPLLCVAEKKLVTQPLSTGNIVV